MHLVVLEIVHTRYFIAAAINYQREFEINILPTTYV